ncbi:3770_t:CDS:1, partial [Racocetra fulgida]
DFWHTSLVCQEWKKILDNHKFWKKLNNQLGFESLNPKARKYNTYYSIYNKNWKKLCICKKELKRQKQQKIININFKLNILKEYSEYRSEYKGFKFNFQYNSFILFVQKKIEKIILKTENIKI